MAHACNNPKCELCGLPEPAVVTESQIRDRMIAKIKEHAQSQRVELNLEPKLEINLRQTPVTAAIASSQVLQALHRLTTWRQAGDCMFCEGREGEIVKQLASGRVVLIAGEDPSGKTKDIRVSIIDEHREELAHFNSFEAFWKFAMAHKFGDPEGITIELRPSS